MTAPSHYRFLITHVEETARRTPPILSSESRHFWDDILEACDQKGERYNYWIFATRWVRESLVGVMNRGTDRALRSILETLRPSLGSAPIPLGRMEKRTLVAHLLPILMAECLVRIERESRLRFGPAYQDMPPNYHPEDY